MKLKYAIKEPKTKKSQQTFERIVKATEKLYYERGYFNTTIADITKEAHIALGTFYLYFNDKLELFHYIILKFRREIRMTIKAEVSKHQDRFDQEYYGLKAFIDYTVERPQAYRIIWDCQYVDYELFKEYYEDFADSYARQLAPSMGKEMKSFDRMNAAYFLMGVANFIGLKWAVFDQRYPTKAEMDEIIEMIRHGFENPMFYENKER